MKKFLIKNKLSLALYLFLTPFLLLIIGDNCSNYLWWDVKPLYTFGIPLKDALTLWIAVGGSLSVLYNIHLSQNRFEQQEKQIKKQETDSQIQFELQNKQIELQKEQITQQSQQINLQLEEQISNRYLKALEMLSNESHDLVIGAIYNLEAIARLTNPNSNGENEGNNFTVPIINQFITLLNKTITIIDEYENSDFTSFLSPKDTVLVLKILFDSKTGLTRLLKNNPIRIELGNLCIYKIRLNNLAFHNVIFEGLSIEESTLNHVDFKNCEFRNTSILNSSFDKVVFAYCSLHSSLLITNESRIYECRIIENSKIEALSNVRDSILDSFKTCKNKPSIEFV